MQSRTCKTAASHTQQTMALQSSSPKGEPISRALDTATELNTEHSRQKTRE